jgi:multidrug efflux pump subunit AcrA (membrane-fusion protein)
VDEIPNVKYIPLEALHVEGNKNFVYRKTASGYDRIEVQVGYTNSDYIIIESGLEKGDKVALIDPTVIENEEEVNKKETT